MTCIPATVSNCQNGAYTIPDINLIYASLSPKDIISADPPKGVVVYFTGGDGMYPADGATGVPPNDLDYIKSYFEAGYVIVQMAWQTPWEVAYGPIPGSVGNIQNAACRQATFLKYIYDNIYVANVYDAHTNPAAGMCAQGFSAGSAAIAYSLAYYGADSYLDNVELMAGPVLSDVKKGCIEPRPTNPNIPVCATNGGINESWCKLGPGGSSWTGDTIYGGSALGGVRSWTKDISCGDSSTTSTTNSQNAWQAQSIVDGGTGATPTFTYPHTAMAGWLCRSVQNNNPPNNSSPQGELFYKAVGANTALSPFLVYAVDNCAGAEGVTSYNSNVPGASIPTDAIHAIENDMIGNSTVQPPLPARCVRRH